MSADEVSETDAEIGGDAGALLPLIDALKRRDYAFVCPTPATHARVIARLDRRTARNLTDALGWSLPFEPDAIDPEIVELLERGGALAPAAAGLRQSTLRVSSLGGNLYLHSAFPTEARDAVFFGPDSYRFAALISAELAQRSRSTRRLADIGTGAGVGAITAALHCPGAEVIGTDINPAALRLAALNAQAAQVKLDTRLCSTLDGVIGPIDVILANPPYIIDQNGRNYRDGGGLHGGEATLTMAREALPRLAPGGTLILYTGSAILRGRDVLGEELAALARRSGGRLDYRELDPDVFGEELENAAYHDVDRIAVVAAVFTQDD